MTFVVANRVRESSSTIGTGTFTLAGALTRWQSFASAVGSGNTCKYAIVNQNANEWEIGEGTITTASNITYLARNSVEESTNLDALVSFTAGTKLVTLVYTAEQLTSIDSIHTSIDSRLTSIDNRVTSVNTQLGVVSAAVTSVSNIVVIQSAAITSVDSRVTSVGSAVTSVAAVASAADVVLDARITSVNNQLGVVSAALTSVSNIVVTNTAAITSINNVTTSINQTISVNGAAITSVDSRVTSVNTDLGGRVTSVNNTLDARITSVNGNVLHDTGANGFVVRTALTSTTARTITGGTYIVIANGDGTAGNPTVSVDVSALDLRYMTLGTTQSVTANKVFEVTIQTSGLQANGPSWNPLVSLTDAASVAVNMARSNKFVLTLGGNRTLEAPTNLQPGQGGLIHILQDGTGGRTLSYNTVWKFPNSVAPVLTSVSASHDILVFEVYSSTHIDAALRGDFR